MDIQIKYGGKIRKTTLYEYCYKYLTGRIYKLLPLKEQNDFWEVYLESLCLELVGANELLLNKVSFLSLVNKLQSLKFVEEHGAFKRIIFDCIHSSKKIGDTTNELL